MKVKSWLQLCFACAIVMTMGGHVLAGDGGTTTYTEGEPGVDEDGGVVDGTGTCSGQTGAKGINIPARARFAINLPAGVDVQGVPNVTLDVNLLGLDIIMRVDTGGIAAEAAQRAIDDNINLGSNPGPWQAFESDIVSVPSGTLVDQDYRWTLDTTPFTGKGVGEDRRVTVYVSDDATNNPNNFGFNQTLLAPTGLPVSSVAGLVVTCVFMMAAVLFVVPWRRKLAVIPK